MDLKWVSIWKKNIDFNGFRWIEMGFNMENIIWILMGLDGLKWVSICKKHILLGLDGLKSVSICKKHILLGLDGFKMGFNMEKISISMGLDGLKWVFIWKTYGF